MHGFQFGEAGNKLNILFISIFHEVFEVPCYAVFQLQLSS